MFNNLKPTDSPSKTLDEINPDDLYDYLVGDCADLISQLESLITQNRDENKKIRNPYISLDLEDDNILASPTKDNEDNLENYEKNINLTTENEEIENNYDENLIKNTNFDEPIETEDYDKLKNNLLLEKKNLEKQFLDISIDIQKKKSQYEEYQLNLKETKEEIEKLDVQIQEKEEFILFLKDQISSIISNSKKI